MELVASYLNRSYDRLAKILKIASDTIEMATSHYKHKPNTNQNRQLMQEQINFALKKLEQDYLPANRFIMVDIQESAQIGTIVLSTYFADHRGKRISDEQMIEEILSMDSMKRKAEKAKQPYFKGYQPNWMKALRGPGWSKKEGGDILGDYDRPTVRF
ncbi:hypothetical protein GZH47_33665 (plasmid) [Paenibacillus rhizovicinus]|uniref:Uncharacterized protein n=1 Tax=Paenibacillus rhizovicinus TaxID=2704463 RepID=A0A6C0PCZ7_9BACL|nr:hypothetical protein [Paenibacillus rhizovicinus]QHW35842.1 hypothetical protein GZH47_33665 [Paenibacillus rhizovicinus]